MSPFFIGYVTGAIMAWAWSEMMHAPITPEPLEPEEPAHAISSRNQEGAEL